MNALRSFPLNNERKQYHSDGRGKSRTYFNKLSMSLVEWKLFMNVVQDWMLTKTMWLPVFGIAR